VSRTRDLPCSIVPSPLHYCMVSGIGTTYLQQSELWADMLKLCTPVLYLFRNENHGISLETNRSFISPRDPVANNTWQTVKPSVHCSNDTRLSRTKALPLLSARQHLHHVAGIIYSAPTAATAGPSLQGIHLKQTPAELHTNANKYFHLRSLFYSLLSSWGKEIIGFLPLQSRKLKLRP
jgi:hypothetical protein